MRNISIYSLIGVLNTAVHWLIFYVFLSYGVEQSKSNLIAFSVAVTFSFVLNAKYNFKSKMSKKKYILFIAGMGAISFIIGFIADEFNLQPLVTLITFSAVSFFLGYLYSKLIIFRSK